MHVRVKVRPVTQKPKQSQRGGIGSHEYPIRFEMWKIEIFVRVLRGHMDFRSPFPNQVTEWQASYQAIHESVE